MVAALRDYLQRRRALRPAPADPALFVSAYGNRLITALAQAEFRRITALTGIGANAVNPPRIHDLRHYADGWVMRPAVTFGLAEAAELVLPSA